MGGVGSDPLGSEGYCCRGIWRGFRCKKVIGLGVGIGCRPGLVGGRVVAVVVAGFGLEVGCKSAAAAGTGVAVGPEGRK